MGTRLSSMATPVLSRKSLDTLLVTNIPLASPQRAQFEGLFKEVLHLPRGSKEITPDYLARADVIYGHLPTIESKNLAPNLKFIQLASAGSDYAIANPLWKDPDAQDIILANASGVHISSIPQYFIATTLALYHKLQQQIVVSQVEKRWASESEIGGGQLFIRELRGKTVGIMGYGQLGRESARLADAFGANIVVATSDGKRKPQNGYMIPRTGDPDGSIPSAWYTTKSEDSLSAFLRATDVLLIALPSTPATQHIINAARLSQLKPSAVLVNIGRGDLVDTSALLHALDSGALAGAALDVTEPEPLPAGHPLFGRPDVIVTPHLGGRTEVYFGRAADILVENVRRWREDAQLVNVVDRERGY